MELGTNYKDNVVVVGKLWPHDCNIILRTETGELKLVKIKKVSDTKGSSVDERLSTGFC